MWNLHTLLTSRFVPALGFFEGETPTIQVSDILGILDNITTQFSVANIVALLGGVIGVGIAFVFLWWGGRKAFRIVMRAVTKGKISI